MKIREVRATPVNIDYREPERWSQGHRLGVTSIVVEIETDKGIVGLGESVPAPSPEVTLGAIKSVTPLLTGQDPRRVSQRWRDVQTVGGFGAFPHTGNAALAGARGIFFAAPHAGPQDRRCARTWDVQSSPR